MQWRSDESCRGRFPSTDPLTVRIPSSRPARKNLIAISPLFELITLLKRQPAQIRGGRREGAKVPQRKVHEVHRHARAERTSCTTPPMCTLSLASIDQLRLSHLGEEPSARKAELAPLQRSPRCCRPWHAQPLAVKGCMRNHNTQRRKERPRGAHSKATRASTWRSLEASPSPMFHTYRHASNRKEAVCVL